MGCSTWVACHVFHRGYVDTPLDISCDLYTEMVLNETTLCSFVVLLTLHLSLFISVINQLDAQNFFFYNKFISCLYMFRAHVLIIRRSKLHYTASGIIKPIGVTIPEAV